MILHPFSRDLLSLGSYGSDMDEYLWNEEVFYVIELALPEILGKANSNKKKSMICDTLYPKDFKQ